MTFALIRFDLTGPMQNVSSAFDAITPWIFSVAFLVTLVGYYAQVYKRRTDAPKMFEALGIIALCVMFAASISFWRPLVVNVLYWPAEELGRQNTNFRVDKALNSFFSDSAKLLSEAANEKPDNGNGALSKAWNFVWDFGKITRAALLDLIIHAIVQILAFVAAFLILPFYFMQHVLVNVLFAFMPISICALSVPALKDKATSYIAMTLSTLAWPLGFSIVAVATNIVFSVPFEPQMDSAAGAAAGSVASYLAPSLQLIVAAIVMIFGTILVPPTMLFLFLYGGTHIDPMMSAMRSIPMLGSFARR